eukprot:gnl/TRDRNA2_/TRDRNA2_183690_c0_seq1.p1 gnl/TRDRNA2_/TRDRNA2_183690_c0~~gnl/TRDRNA2_/TRDRNA2_183690_c0_seq1.p1  ORF type:complete len:372 (-),score=91.66 gnl/TRDRNA2_/TRDRNA2_183690_c0_seq1:112-1227(-)
MKTSHLPSMSLSLVCFLFAAPAAAWRLRKSEDAAKGWHDMACSMDLSRYGMNVDASNIVFRAGNASNGDGNPEVLVFQDNKDGEPRRTLVFKGATGKCNPQAGSMCSRVDKSAAAAAFDDDEGGVDDHCASQLCVPDVSTTVQEDGGGYVRSMAGAMTLLPKTSSEPHILSIGLGAGTLPMMLRKAFGSSRQTVVELSSEVVQAAGCFGGGAAEYDTVNDDGRGYIERAQDAEFDAVLVDVFDGEDKVPSCFTTSEFFHTVRRTLKPDGLLVMNSHSGTTLHNDAKDLVPAARKVFGNVQIGDAPGLGNKIVLARNSANVTSLLQESPGSSDDGSGVPLQQWFAAANFQPADSLYADSKVLTDSAVECSVR